MYFLRFNLAFVQFYAKIFPVSTQQYIPRAIEQHVLKLSTMYPCVTLTGPRQSGKTTMARHLFPHFDYVSMENPNARELFLRDPQRFLELHPAPAIFDEVQNTPDLLSYLQGIMDEADRAGMYILTGSHQPALRQAVGQSLAGRTGLVSLLPLSLAEMEAAGLTPSRDEAIYQGGLPRVISQRVTPELAYADYFATYIERDVRQISNVRNLHSFENFVRLLAARVSQQLNMNALANDLNVSAPTIREWISVLEASHIIYLLQPYYQNLGKRIIKSPKVYFTEVGLAAHLLDITSPAEVDGHPLVGGLFENLAVIEALKACYNRGARPHLYYYRDVRKFEVDLIVNEHLRPRPIEIKSTPKMTPTLPRLADNASRFAKEHNPGCTPGLIYGGDEDGSFPDMDVASFRHVGRLVFKDSPLA